MLPILLKAPRKALPSATDGITATADATAARTKNLVELLASLYTEHLSMVSED
jgi:hypothetical protein